MAKNQKVFLSYIIIFLGLVTVWYLGFYPWLETIKSNYLLFILIWFIGKTLIWILPVFIYLKVIGIKDSRGFLKLANNWTKGIGWGLILGLLWVLLRLILFRFILGDKTITLEMEPFLWIATSLSGPFEEIPFRGLILQQLNEQMSFRKANALSALLFLIYHLPTWSVTGFQNLVPNCLIVLLLGLVWGFVLKKTKSIWAPSIFHTVH
ncbi:MAG TPA: type II CAAX endopeptidase family protein, partial [Bacillota bacterium]|nr:type II CAAX endopeptidase family protein [Bacillota bacterium]